MAKKSKRSSSGGDDIVDERFAAAATRPQFSKARSGARRNSNNAPATAGDNKPKDSDGQGGSLAVGTSNGDRDDNNASLASSGLGASLTEAIASDDRFKAALNSDKFGCVPSRDKYGRKTKKKKSKQQLGEEEEGNVVDEEEEGGGEESTVEEEEEDEKKKSEKKKKKDDEEEEDAEPDNSMETRIAYLNALSRGDISASSSSEDDSSSDDDGDSDDSSASSTNVYGKSGIFDPRRAPLPGDAPGDEASDAEAAEQLTFESSPYLCILNLNWERTRAVDVYAMLHSFCPPGSLRGVQVYPSDFGKERMEKERIEGPTGLWKKDKKGAKEGEESFWSDDEGPESDASSAGNDEDKMEDDEELDNGDSDGSDLDSDDDEDVLNLADATSKLYAHFPDQSTITKNSQLQVEDEEEEGFDMEKLREYEVSKMRYYFAIATFNSSEAAEAVYESVDGMEMEDSAAEIDVRVLPKEAHQDTIEGRKLRDECTNLPAKYVPPENVVTAALRQSRVTCSWERGDADRERTLTRYGMGKDAWEAMAEGDDIKFYLATSDNSSEEEPSDSEDEAKKEAGRSEKKKKGAGMRAMLGLAGSDSEDSYDGAKMDDQSISEDSSIGIDSDDEDAKEKDAAKSKKKQSKPAASSSTESESEGEKEDTKKVTFTPGKRALEDKIRSKLHAKQQNAADGKEVNAGGEQLTPFEKYLEKRKEKRKERKRAAKSAKENGADNDDALDDDDGMYGDGDEFGTAQFSDEEEGAPVVDVNAAGEDDGFFLGESSSKSNKKKKDKKQQHEQKSDDKMASTKEELELLIAGDDDEENQKDYDMRGLTKLEKHAHKKLRGKRKRQLETLAANVSGQDFTIDTTDDRFGALLDGTDARFGIDRTNPAYKETGAMKELLQEQSKRRRKKNRGGGKDEKNAAVNAEAAGEGKKMSNKKNKEKIVKDGDGGWVEKNSGAMALSSLVMSLQSKVPKASSSSAGGLKKKKKTSKKKKASAQ